MGGIMQMESQLTSQPPPARLFDWHLDVRRLEREAKQATSAGRADPWTLVEAECSLDLIGAELAALKNRDSRQVADSVAELQSWRARIERVVRTLQSLGNAN